jgi:hypothetical protein
MSGGVSLTGLAQEFIAFNTGRHCLGFFAQALGFLTQTWAEGLNGIKAPPVPHLRTPLNGREHNTLCHRWMPKTLR